ncbi:MAG: PIN domain-containing protein [Ignavibacteriae bacterium]|nr:PIN domain-containing protein [Ignavibacteriota bacterium]
MVKNGTARIYIMSKIFIDTNILIYSLNNNDEIKKNSARNILKNLIKNHQLVISTQVIQEFYVTATKKLNVDAIITKSIINSFQNFEIVTVNYDLINNAIDCSILNMLSFWDSLIIVSAQFSKCSEIYTEDLNLGQNILGVKIINPFK